MLSSDVIRLGAHMRNSLSVTATIYCKSWFVQHPPELIVAHGKANWPEYKAIFDELIWRKDGPFQWATCGTTRIVLAHQLAGKEFNTGNQLEHFAQIALPNTIAVPNLPEPTTTTFASANNRKSVTENPERNANRSVRQVFAVLVRSHRVASGLSAEDVAMEATNFAGQGNPGGVHNL